MVARTARKLALALAASLVPVGTAPSSAAQTIREAVEGHVRKGIEKKKRKHKKRKRKKRRHRARRPPPRRSAAPPRPAPAERAKKSKGPRLPKRVIGKQLRLDPQIGVAYRGWRPQQYPSVEVETASYLTGRIELQATLFGILKLNRGFYESNALAAPRRTEATVAAKAGKALPKIALFLGSLSVPFDFIWEPMVLYEAYAMEATAKPRRPVQIIPRSAGRNDDLGDVALFPETTRDLTVEARFETFVVAAKYKPDKDSTGLIGDDVRGKIPPFYVGLGYTGYSKPYQLTVGDLILEKQIFDARFRGGGLAFGVETPQRADAFFLDGRGQLGLGEIRLLEDLTVNDALPDDWLIGYFRGDLTLGYLYALTHTRPTLMLGAAVSGGGATFFAFKTVSRKGENAPTPPLNWDVLWGAQVYVVLPL